MPVEIVKEPSVDKRPEIQYMGIRVRTPMSGMHPVADKLRKELTSWFSARSLEADGPPFLRYHVIDMAGEMDIAVGIPVRVPVPYDGRVVADFLPAGRYVSQTYIGHGLVATKMLLNWVHANSLAMDRWNEPEGDVFRCRIERFLTDPKIEHRKTRWQIELAIKLAND